MKVDSPEVAQRYWKAVIRRQPWFDNDKEQLVVLLLSTRYEVQGFSLVAVGSLNETVAHPREIFRAAVASGSYAIIVLHNHPSGDPSPSETDRSLTQRLAAAADVLQVKLLDHVIISQRGRIRVRLPKWKRARMSRKMRVEEAAREIGYFSFKEACIL